MSKEIFISHSKHDEKVGEKLVDSLIELGVPRDTIFYSSKYHTGIKYGKNFPEEIKTALQECKLVIFLLTKNFYKSPYCLNEMGAAWFAGKYCIPILLDGLTEKDMLGFYDSKYLAMFPNNESINNFVGLLTPYIDVFNDISKAEYIFKDFIDEANKISASENQDESNIKDIISELETDILMNKFTDSELLLFNFFIIINYNNIDENIEFDYFTEEYKRSKSLQEFERYSSRFVNVDFEKGKSLLKKNDYLLYKFNRDNEYTGCELKINIFRDLISLSERGRKHIEAVVTKHIAINDEKNELKQNEINNNLENYILNSKLKELDALLFVYMKDTNDFNLGDRWKADKTIEKIKKWEHKRLLNNKLSSNYQNALSSLLKKEMFEVESITAYGNPREYRLKDEYIYAINHLSESANQVLSKVIERNADEEDDLPF